METNVIFESSRLLELAGIKGTDGLLTESIGQQDSKDSDGAAASSETVPETDLTEDEIRETIREELSSLWSSGKVFGKQNEDAVGVTLGFAGFGFKK